jgi:predicted DNA binding protein
MLEAELAIRHHGCPVSDVSASHPQIRLENVSRVRLSDGAAKRLLALEGEPDNIAAFTEEFREHETTVSFKRVSESDAKRAYFISEIEYQTNNPSILSLIDEAGCFQYSSVVVEKGIEHWMIYTQRKTSLRDLVETLEQSENNVELARNVDVGPITNEHAIHHEALRSELTDKQLAAFEAALELGYYDEHDRATIDNIATMLDVHRSTAGEHIKHAENTLMSEVGEDLFPDAVSGET